MVKLILDFKFHLSALPAVGRRRQGFRILKNNLKDESRNIIKRIAGHGGPMP